MLYRSMIVCAFFMLVGCAAPEQDYVGTTEPTDVHVGLDGLEVPFPLHVWMRDDLPSDFRYAASLALFEINKASGQDIFDIVYTYGESNITIQAYDNDTHMGQTFCSPGSCDIYLERAYLQDFINRIADGHTVVEHEFLHALGYRGDKEGDSLHDEVGLMGTPMDGSGFSEGHIAFLKGLKPYTP